MTFELSCLRAGGGGQGNKFENRKGLSFIKENNLGYNEKPDWVDTQVQSILYLCSACVAPANTACFLRTKSHQSLHPGWFVGNYQLHQARHYLVLRCLP